MRANACPAIGTGNATDGRETLNSHERRRAPGSRPTQNERASGNEHGANSIGIAETVEYLGVIMADPCVYCGSRAEQVDHIQAVSKGGTNHWSNFAPACSKCNRAKWAKPLLTYLLERVE